MPTGPVAPSAETPVLINGQTIDELLQCDGAAEAVYTGTPLFWLGLKGLYKATVTMHDGRATDVIADRDDGLPVDGALLWSPQGHPAFCFEPVIGMSEATPGGNRGLIIRESQQASLSVTLIPR